jgi:hypothetical protein
MATTPLVVRKKGFTRVKIPQELSRDVHGLVHRVDRSAAARDIHATEKSFRAQAA